LPCISIATAFFFAPAIAKAQNSELAGVSALIEQGKLEEAERLLHQYLLKRPQSPAANSLLANVYLKQEHFEQAEQALQKAIASAPNLVQPRLSLGDAYAAEGKLDLAVKAYQGVIKFAPRDARAGLALAKLYLGQGAYAKSIEAAESIPPEKRIAELLPTLAADYFGLQQVEKAGLEVQNMLQIADKQPDLVPENTCDIVPRSVRPSTSGNHFFPIPVTSMLTDGLLGSSLVTVRVCETLPLAVGWKVTVTV